MEARGTSAWRKKRTARPPRPMKSGAPRTTAATRATSAIVNGAAPRVRPEETNATHAAAAAATAARTLHAPDAPRTSRHATRRNPAGITASASHTGRKGTTYCRELHSARTSWNPDQASSRETAADTAAEYADNIPR